MKVNKYPNKFDIAKNCGILLLVAISLLMLNGNAFSADKHGLYPLTLVNDKVNDTLLEPLKRFKKAIDLINLKYQETLSDEVEAQVSREDFKWVFEADGISLVNPVVNQENGTVFVTTTDIDFRLKLINLITGNENVFDIGNLQSKLYALKPDSISSDNIGEKEWEFSVDGVITFPPVLSNGDTFVMSIDRDVDLSDLDGLDDLEDFLDNLKDLGNILNDIGGRLTAINKDGQEKWDTPVKFDRAFPIGPPVVTTHGLILTTTLKIPDISDVSSIAKNLTGVVSAFNTETGEEKWSFDPAKLNSGSRLTVINTPTFNNSTIFVNAISTTSEKEINEFIEFTKTTITDIQNEVKSIITNAISELLDITLNGGDIQPVVNNITEKINLLINDNINNITNELPNVSSRLFALDLDGEIMWDSRFAGTSVTSPIITDSGINVNSTNFSLGDISFDIDINVTLSSEGILKVNTTINLLIAGTSINVGMALTLDTASDDPLDTLRTVFDSLDFSEVLGASTISTSEGVSTTFNETDGKLKWQTKIGKSILFKPIVSDSQIIAATSGFNTNNETKKIELANPIIKVYSINTVNGGINWISDQIEGTTVSSVLLGSDNDVFLTYLDNGALQVQAFNLDDGSVKWTNLIKTDNFVTSASIINPNDGMIFLSTSKTGDALGFETSLRDLFPTLKGEIIGLDPSTGSVEKTIEVDGFPLASPAIDATRNTIYSITSDYKTSLFNGTLDFITLVNASDL
ncbi:MAG: outer membrane protein assembly factor BamB family protein [Candidatus Anammoxibacter sp.]